VNEASYATQNVVANLATKQFVKLAASKIFIINKKRIFSACGQKTVSFAVKKTAVRGIGFGIHKRLKTIISNDENKTKIPTMVFFIITNILVYNKKFKFLEKLLK
jgi:hypothetical protein